jgi:hypothetical protein
MATRDRKQAYFEALDANVPVVQDQDDVGRTKITDAVYQWFTELQLFQGPDQCSRLCGSGNTSHLLLLCAETET